MAHSEDNTHGEEQVGHVVSIKFLVAIGITLLIFTAITVYTATQIDLGSGNIWLALIIAFLKGSLVCLFFMHLRWDSPFNAFVLVCALLFVVLFIGIAMTDTSEYQPVVKDYEMSTPEP